MPVADKKDRRAMEAGRGGVNMEDRMFKQTSGDPHYNANSLDLKTL